MITLSGVATVLVLFSETASTINLEERLQTWFDAPQASICVRGVSRDQFFRAGLLLSDFDRYLETDGPDYTIIVNGRTSVDRLARLIVQVVNARPQEVAVRGGPQSLDRLAA